LNSTKILEALDLIAAAKPKEKLVILAKHAEDPEFKRVLNAAYNPFITFGIKPQRVSGHGKEDFTDETWSTLSALANRKLVGNDAKGTCDRTMDRLNGASAELFWRISNKDLKAGFGESTINKVLKNFIPEFPYMRCSLPKAVDLGSWDWEGGIISQVKLDGRFTNVNVEPTGEVALTSRQGKAMPIEKFPQIAHDLRVRAPRGTQSHGEMLVMKDGKVLPRQVGNGMIEKVCEGGEFEEGCTPALQLWDNIPLSCVVKKGKCVTPYALRLGSLLKAFKDCETVSVAETRIVKSIGEAVEHFLEVLKRGGEGTVVKRKDGVWEDTGGSGSIYQVKMKIAAEVELKIVGYREGKEGSKREETIGALLLHSGDDLLEVGAGSGLKQADLDRYAADREGNLGGIVTIQFNDIMEPSESNELHSLFLPVFIEHRFDKSTADNLQTIKAVLAEAKTGKELLTASKKK